jgi:MFS family permease
MYLPSPVTGWLADAVDARVVTGMGALLLIAAGSLAAVAGSGRSGVIVALLVLGVGWAAGLIGGSALLRDTPVAPSLHTRAEGLGELGMGAAAAVGSNGAGLLLAGGSFGLLGLAAAAPTCCSWPRSQQAAAARRTRPLPGPPSTLLCLSTSAAEAGSDALGCVIRRKRQPPYLEGVAEYPRPVDPMTCSRTTSDSLTSVPPPRPSRKEAIANARALGLTLSSG